MLLIADIIVFILFVVLPFGLSFIFKKKAIRIGLQILSGLLFIWFIHDLVGKNSIELEGEKKIVGLYKLNVDSSKIENVDLKKYSDLTLTVKSNNTFVINRQTSFLNSTTGKWNLHDDGDIGFVEYQFDNEKYSHQLFPYDTWTFESYDLKGAREDDKIMFTKE
jgi:hypothetical protein